MRTKQLLTKTLLVVAVLLAGVSSAWAVDIPDPVYFNDFSSTTGLTIVGNGEFITDADPAFGKVFHNDPANASAIRTNYLQLPADVLSHSTTSNEMTIGFWVNKKGEDSFFYTPLFAAYGAAPSSGNTTPMFVCETRGLLQLNCSGYCDFGINDGTPGTTYNDGVPYVNTVWLDDAEWHYYTVALTTTKAKVYIDGVLKNGWTVDGSSDGQVISGLFSNGSSLSYVTLGGNQAWTWGDPDPAFAFDDFAVYDKALSAEQIAQIMTNKGKAASTYSITYDFKNFVSSGTTSGYLTKNSTVVSTANSTIYYPSSYVDELGGKIAMAFSYDRWSISNTDSDKGLIWNQGADERFSIMGLKAGDKVTINTTSGTIYFSTAGNCTGTYYTGTNYADDATGIPVQWAQLVSGNTYTILADGQLNLQAKRNDKAAGRAQKSEKLVISSIVIEPSQAETMTAPSISSEATDGGRNVTITSGVSNLLFGKTTYYTTDGSTPTALSTKYTGTFLQTTTATIKAITISNSSAATESIVTEQEVNLDVVDNPVMTVTGANNNNRIVTITCATDGATIYYSETEKANTDDGWSTYSTPVSTAATKLYAYAGKGSTKSEVVNIATGAGSTLALAAPTATLSSISLGMDGFYYPVYTFASDQSGVLGTPEVTYSYTIDGVDKGTAANYWSIGAATLVVTANAEGYNSTSSDDISILGGKFLISNIFDYTEPSKTDFTTAEQAAPSGGDAQSINNTGCTFYNLSNLTSTFWEGATLSGFVLAIGTSKGVTQGVYTRSSAGSITFTLTEGQIVYTTAYERTGTATGNLHSYFTPYSTGSDVLNIPKYYLAYQSTVYTPVPNNVSKSISSAGWATYCSPYALDLENATGLTDAYIVTGGAGGVLAKTSVKGGTVPANTGLLLKADEGTATIPVVASSATDVSSNILEGVTTNTVIAAEAGWVLMGSPSLGFYQNSYEFTVGANTAYIPVSKLPVPAGGAPVFYLFGEGETTGISASLNDKAEMTNDNAIYNLNGQRVAQPTKGLFIVNGKKVVIK